MVCLPTASRSLSLRRWAAKESPRLSQPTLYFFCTTLFLISVLYGCVGQGGGSGYIAAMALFGFAPDSIKPTALVLNVLASGVVSLRFYRAGHFSWRLLFPFAVSSVPTALLGGYITLPPVAFSRLLGALLLVAAVPFIFPRDLPSHTLSPPRLLVALLAGASMGLLSGLTGVGGGILIMPLFLYNRWATPKTAAALTGVFVLINSVAALLGHLAATHSVPPGLPLFGIAAVLGGMVGAQLGSVHLSASAIYRILGAVLLLSSAKLIFA